MKYYILLGKSGHVLLLLWKLFFTILSQQQHINKQFFLLWSKPGVLKVYIQRSESELSSMSKGPK